MIEARKDVLVERDLPDPEVTPKARRRIFKAAYKNKKRILAEVEAAAGSGQIGEILRREGIYSSTLTGWRKEREAAVDAAFLRSGGRNQNTIHSPARTRNCAAGMNAWKKSCAKPNLLSRSKKNIDAPRRTLGHENGGA
jgi:hypothetical protein